MTEQQIKKAELLKNTEVFLLDLDGTVYLDGTPIGDMINTLKTLRKMGKRLIFLTNALFCPPKQIWKSSKMILSL